LNKLSLNNDSIIKVNNEINDINIEDNNKNTNDKHDICNDNNNNNFDNEKLKNKNVLNNILPGEIIDNLNQKNNWKIRTQAIDNLQEYISNIKDPSILINNLQFYFDFSINLLNDINFKVALTSLSIIKQLIYKSGLYILKYIDIIVPILIQKLNDKKKIIQQNIIEIFLLISHIISPKDVIKSVLNSFNSDNVIIYYQMVKLIFHILNENPNSNYDFNELVTYLIPLLESNNEKLVNITYETLNIIANISSLYSQKILNIIKNNKNNCDLISAYNKPNINDNISSITSISINNEIIKSSNSNNINIDNINNNNNNSNNSIYTNKNYNKLPLINLSNSPLTNNPIINSYSNQLNMKTYDKGTNCSLR